MYRYLILIAIICFSSLKLYAAPISGNVRQDDYFEKKSVVIDKDTEKPIDGAKVLLPQYGFQTKTDESGRFVLHADINNSAILQIEKEGYRPFSLTVDETVTERPLKLGIQKLNADDAFVDSGIYHLGDDVYSPNSANCKQFRVKPLGPFYSRTVRLKPIDKSKQAVIVFGSVIGLDTKLAKELGQNAIVSVYSSPVDVIFNGNKIGELNMNGDNQQIVIPDSIIKNVNELTVRTGKNLFQYNYIDYDDMEFANLRIEIRDKIFARK